MKDEEALTPAGRGSIALVQSRDAVRRDGEQIVVARNAFRRRVEPIRKQRELQISIRVSEVVHFQMLDLL